MLSTFSKYTEDVSVLRRLLFAVAQLPEDLPNVWEIATEFATKNKTNCTMDVETVKVLVDNLREFDSDAFESDQKLFQDLLRAPMKKPLGLVLMPNRNKCILCKSELKLRKDRPASVVVYDDNIGTIPGSHFHKICTNKSCSYVQYYGYYTCGSSPSKVFFNDDWESLPYFVSSRETVFSMTALKRFNSGILLGQLSFKQSADIYNHLHNCKNIPSEEKFP